MTAPIAISRTAALAAALVALTAGFAVGHLALPAVSTAGAARATGAASTPVANTNAPKRYQVPVTHTQPSRGPVDALVTLVHYCDFESAECRQIAPLLDRALAKHGADVRLVFRHFPAAEQASMSAHELAQLAHDRGGKFWEVRAQLLATATTPQRAELERIASSVGLDWPEATKALDEHRYSRHVLADRTFAGMFEVARVPVLFVNGRKLEGVPTAAALDALIDEEAARARALIARGIDKSAVYAELIKGGFFRRPELAGR